MSHELFRLTSKLYETPHLISLTAFSNIVSYLESRNTGVAGLSIIGDIQPRTKQLNIVNNNIGVISVDGALTSTAYEGMCGEEGCSYDNIRQQMNQFVDKGIKTVVLDVDSGGGEAYMMMETANYIRNLADDNDIKLISYNDGCMASAAIGLGCVAHEVITNPEAESGSIGVVIKLRNYNKAMTAVGVEDTYIFAGDSKIPFDKEGEFTEGFLSDLQERVDTLYENFTGHVAMWRGLDVKAVKDTQAKMFSAKKSLELGLVDSIMTHQEFISYLTDITSNEEPMSLFKPKTTNKDTSMSVENLGELQTALAASIASFEAQQASHTKELASFADKFAALEAELTASKAALAVVEKEKVEAKATSRLSQLTAAFGAEKAPGLNASFAALDDASFATALSAFKGKQDSEDAVLETQTSQSGEAVIDAPIEYSAAVQSDLSAQIAAKYKQQ